MVRKIGTEDCYFKVAQHVSVIHHTCSHISLEQPFIVTHLCISPLLSVFWLPGCSRKMLCVWPPDPGAGTHLSACVCEDLDHFNITLVNFTIPLSDT